MPNVLAFDTSAAHCAAALISGEDVIHRIDHMARGQAEHLMPMLSDILTDQGLAWSDLDAIGVGTGPGNFTGIRISVAAARGLALGLGVPAIGVTTFEAIAHGKSNCLVALDAPRGDFYVQAFVEGGDRTPRQVSADLEGMPKYPGRAEPMIIGPAAARLSQAWPERTGDPRYPMPVAIARIARSRMHNPDNPRPQPFYLRAADAAPSRTPAPVILT